MISYVERRPDLGVSTPVVKPHETKSGTWQVRMCVTTREPLIRRVIARVELPDDRDRYGSHWPISFDPIGDVAYPII